MSLIRSVNNDLKCGQFAPAGGGQFAPAEVVKINRQVVVSLLWRELFFLSGLSKLVHYFHYVFSFVLRAYLTSIITYDYFKIINTGFELSLIFPLRIEGSGIFKRSNASI